MKDDREFRTVRGYQLLEQKKRLLTSAMEDYLEMIYRESLLGDGYLRINKLAEVLNVQAPSATKMVQKLTNLGLINYQKYGIIILTDKGKQIGEFLLSRHQIIEAFLKSIGIQNTLVETELIEHNISIHTLQTIDLLNKFLAVNPDFIEKFERFKQTSLNT
jgi:DtxR family Mn-dependent transcriptional regulator